MQRLRGTLMLVALVVSSAGCGSGERAPCEGAELGASCNDGLCWNGAADGECDGNGACRTQPSTTGKCVVFLTSDEHSGDLGGLTGADAICQKRARAAGLEGTFKAWLSDSRTSAAERLTHASVPYVDTQGHVIADDWADLVDGAIARTICLDEYQYEWSHCSWLGGLGRIWTGTRGDGTAAPPFCSDWREGGDETQEGRVGYYCESNGAWTDEGTRICSIERSLYCFQQ